jgi:hypothetical protein
MNKNTVSGLKHIFPLIKIELRNENEIFVEDKLFEFSAIPSKNHIITKFKIKNRNI